MDSITRQFSGFPATLGLDAIKARPFTAKCTFSLTLAVPALCRRQDASGDEIEVLR
jgi:hypothetical protein